MTNDRMTPCPACEGLGEIDMPLGFHTGNPETDDWETVTCWACEGTGEVEAEDEDNE